MSKLDADLRIRSLKVSLENAEENYKRSVGFRARVRWRKEITLLKAQLAEHKKRPEARRKK